MTDFSGQLSQIDFNPAHPVILTPNIMIKQGYVNEIVQLFVPVKRMNCLLTCALFLKYVPEKVHCFPPFWVEGVVDHLGLSLLLTKGYFAVGITASASVHCNDTSSLN